MIPPRLSRLATSLTIALVSVLCWVLVMKEAGSWSESIAISVISIVMSSALFSLLTNLVRFLEDGASPGRTDPVLQEQVLVTCVLRDTPATMNRGELFARLADTNRPLSLARLDAILGELERGGVIASDIDEDTGERSWRLLRTRDRRLPQP